MANLRKRRKRPVFFVCSALINGELICENIESFEQQIAEESFKNRFAVLPSVVFGPFFKKRVQQPIPPTDIVLSGNIKQAEYNGWLVRANILKSPENWAYLIFDRRIDEKKISKPHNKVVLVENIKFRNQS